MPKGAKGPAVGSPVETQNAPHWTRKNFAPIIILQIDGEDQSDLLSTCTNFTYKKHITKAAETHFHFRNDDRDLSDDPRFETDKPWVFRFGFLNDLSAPITAYVRELAPDYSSKMTVDVKLLDASMQMAGNSHSRNWGRIPSSQIALQIAKKNGFKAIVENSDDTPKKAWIQPGNMNDLMYLRDLAAMIDFELFVDGTPPTLIYRARGMENVPKAALTYYDSPNEFSMVKSFKPKVKALGANANAVASGDEKKGKGDKSEAPDKDKKKENKTPEQEIEAYFHFGNGQAGGLIKGNNTGNVVAVTVAPVTKPAPSSTDTKKVAAAVKAQALDRGHEASSAHPLTPSLSIGFVFDWSGLEKPFNGKWYVIEENHTISGTSCGTTCEWHRYSPPVKKNAVDAKKSAGEALVPAEEVYMAMDNGGPGKNRTNSGNVVKMYVVADPSRMVPASKPTASRPKASQNASTEVISSQISSLQSQLTPDPAMSGGQSGGGGSSSGY